MWAMRSAIVASDNDDLGELGIENGLLLIEFNLNLMDIS